MNIKTEILSKVKLLSGLTSEELSELAEDFEWRSYPKHSYIMKEQQDSNLFYVIAEGSAESFVSKSDSHSLQVNNYGSGDVFGQIALFTGKPSTVTVRCLEDCQVLVLDSEHFGHMLVRWPKLYESFISDLSKRLSQVNIDLWEAKYKDLLYSGFRLNQLKYKFYNIWGSTRTTKEVENKLDELVQTNDHVLLIGERGTGQQMMAWYLHKRQFGEKAPFIVIDGKQLDQQWGDLLLESTSKDKTLLKVAEGGSIFIRDVNLISPKVQLKLARALEAKESNCRILGSLLDDTDKLPIALIPQLQKLFNEQYKFKPLRERKKDIPVIAQGIFKQLAQKHGRQSPMLDQEATKLLLTHHYRQGNVTELIQIIERAFFLAEGSVIRIEHLFFGPTAEKIGRSIDLLAWDSVYNLIQSKFFPLKFQKFSFVIFSLLAISLLLAPQTQFGAFAMLIAWGIWWPLLVLSASVFGRIWCAVCPFSFTMQLARKIVQLDKPVPDFIKKYDYILITFFFTLIFWMELITGMRYISPFYTGLWLITIVGAACIIGIIYTRHAWCHHLCPLGGFVGMASISGVLAVRADPEICVNKCKTHECYRGNGRNKGCPMSQHAAFLDSNSSCKLCLRCIRNCPNDAVKLNLRVPAREIWHLVRVNQGFAIFIGVALGILIPITYFEPLHYEWPKEKWQLWFSIFYWGTALVAGILTWLIARPFKTKAASNRIKMVFAFIPMVIAGYVAYQLHFAPGANTVLVGVGHSSSEVDSQIFYVPGLVIGQSIAFISGLTLTGLALFMIWWRARKKKSLS